MCYHKEESRYNIMRVLQWSFDALGCGKHPSADPWNVPFSSSYCPARFKKAGCWLASPGLRGIWDGIQADLEFVKKVLFLQSASGMHHYKGFTSHA
ncbi:unnamed protein product [Symbiodinium natans]|uniref:Uncharacterized protein n=1 Tax=Symbiodinium natans TaxID=878477 RepID=A0A812JNI7_9DINO|nr:unnamed protein product [Symbiodinium natans]